MRRRTLFLSGMAALVALAATPIFGQSYPDRPIRIVVPFPPGGANDIVARAVGAQVELQLGQSVFIENRSGANGIVGTQAVANAEPDGYTLLHVSSSFTINPAVYKKLPYDIFRDFTPVANLGMGEGYVVVVNPKLPIRNIAELIAYARANAMFYGHSGIGNPLQLAAETFKVHASVPLEPVPFRGTAPALTALIAGQVQVVFAPPGTVLGYLEAGQLRAVGFTGGAPLRDKPDVPLVSETLPGFVHKGAWHGWFAPARTPDAVVAKLNDEARAAMRVPRIVKTLRQTGYDPLEQSPAEFAAFVRDDAQRMAEAVRAAKIEPQ